MNIAKATTDVRQGIAASSRVRPADNLDSVDRANFVLAVFDYM